MNPHQWNLPAKRAMYQRHHAVFFIPAFDARDLEEAEARLRLWKQ